MFGGHEKWGVTQADKDREAKEAAEKRQNSINGAGMLQRMELLQKDEFNPEELVQIKDGKESVETRGIQVAIDTREQYEALQGVAKALRPNERIDMNSAEFLTAAEFEVLQEMLEEPGKLAEVVGKSEVDSQSIEGLVGDADRRNDASAVSRLQTKFLKQVLAQDEEVAAQIQAKQELQEAKKQQRRDARARDQRFKEAKATREAEARENLRGLVDPDLASSVIQVETITIDMQDKSAIEVCRNALMRTTTEFEVMSGADTVEVRDAFLHAQEEAYTALAKFQEVAGKMNVVESRMRPSSEDFDNAKQAFMESYEHFMQTARNFYPYVENGDVVKGSVAYEERINSENRPEASEKSMEMLTSMQEKIAQGSQEINQAVKNLKTANESSGQITPELIAAVGQNLRKLQGALAEDMDTMRARLPMITSTESFGAFSAALDDASRAFEAWQEDPTDAPLRSSAVKSYNSLREAKKLLSQ